MIEPPLKMTQEPEGHQLLSLKNIKKKSFLRFFELSFKESLEEVSYGSRQAIGDDLNCKRV